MIILKNTRTYYFCGNWNGEKLHLERWREGLTARFWLLFSKQSLRFVGLCIGVTKLGRDRKTRILLTMVNSHEFFLELATELNGKMRFLLCYSQFAFEDFYSMRIAEEGSPAILLDLF